MIIRPLVSIIIPTYNRAHLITETLESILIQSYQNWECIVIDDGSLDNTAEVLTDYCKRDTRFQYHLRPEDSLKGANTCRNYGFELSKGDYINWFDDDDVMLENFLKNKVNSFSEEVNFVICNGYFVNQILDDRKSMVLKSDIDLFREVILWKQQLITNSILFRRTFLNKKTLFSPNIHRGQEAEFFSRLFFRFPKNQFKVIIEPLYLYRQHIYSKTNENKKYIKKYKESESYFYVQNLKRSLIIKDSDLIYFCYYKLVGYFFLGLKQKHFNNSKYILRKLVKILFQNNKFLASKLAAIGFFLLLIRRGSYTLEKKLKNHKINIC